MPHNQRDTCGGISWMGHDGTDVESYLAQIKY